MKMKALRIAVLGVLCAAAFLIYTSHRFGAAPGELLGRDKLKLDITQAAGPVPLDAEEQNNVEIYKHVSPSVVNITSTTMAFDFFYGAVPQQGAGSGFIIDKEGHILTNYHVVEGARKLEVTLQNKKRFPAEVVGLDQSHDLAVIQIHAPDLRPVTLGDSSGLQVGQKVYAIGNPFGIFSGTMTRGIVSSIRQVQEPDGTYIDEAIQTDAAINPGNSGGPLLNSRGEVIGINTMIASMNGGYSGVGFAIPVNAAKAVLNDLVNYGRVKRPTLGIKSIPIEAELAQELGLPADSGVLIMQVVPGSAAEHAGLRGGNQRAYLGNIPVMIGGDLIVAIDGQTIEDGADIAHVMNNHRAGDAITVTVWRGKNKMDIKVTLGEAKGDRRT